ncbi:hypothetical protein MM236_18475 [Belliella sp. DSM 107340]|uniref:Uncharacterized protein n=1 Tax=Belliella calami TaxID=2923436 RepID=A0ABS9UTM9_9BACT|nr:hypothetical protein [Belliella calami]MCH7399987.1 hypothetical protein [Belliella calami]
MNNSNIYTLGTKLLSKTFSVNSICLGSGADEKGNNDAMNLLEGHLETFNFPIAFKHVSGKNYCDLMGSGWGILYLISDRMKHLLEKERLTGWKCFPIEIVDKNGKKIQEVYHGFSIVGRSGSIIYKKSDVIEKQLVPNGPLSKYYKGIHPEMETWDGSDFFLPKNHWGTMVTQKAKDIMVKNKLTNIMLQNLAEIEVGVNTVLDY